MSFAAGRSGGKGGDKGARPSATRTVAFGQRFLPQPKPPHHPVGLRRDGEVRQAARHPRRGVVWSYQSAQASQCRRLSQSKKGRHRSRASCAHHSGWPGWQRALTPTHALPIVRAPCVVDLGWTSFPLLGARGGGRARYPFRRCHGCGRCLPAKAAPATCKSSLAFASMAVVGCRWPGRPLPRRRWHVRVAWRMFRSACAPRWMRWWFEARRRRMN